MCMQVTWNVQKQAVFKMSLFCTDTWRCHWSVASSCHYVTDLQRIHSCFRWYKKCKKSLTKRQSYDRKQNGTIFMADDSRCVCTKGACRRPDSERNLTDTQNVVDYSFHAWRLPLPGDAFLWDPRLWFQWNDERGNHVLADDVSGGACQLWRLLHRQFNRLLFRCKIWHHD